MFKISDQFRLVALGDSLIDESRGAGWLNEQITSLFMFHTLKPMTIAEKHRIIKEVIPNSDPNTSLKLLKLVDSLHASSDAGV